MVVNRSEDDVDRNLEVENPERDYLFQLGGRRHRDDVEFNELDIKIKVSYKTLLLVFVLFDISHRIINSLSDSSLSGLWPFG